MEYKSFLGLTTTRQASSVAANAVNRVKQMKEGAILSKIKSVQLDRAKAEIQNWRDALDEWEDEDDPSREKMAELYQEIEQDDEVGTHMETIIRRIEGSDFEVGKPVSENGKQAFKADEEKTKLLKTEWFGEIVRLVIEAEMMGYTLVEVKKPQGDEYTLDDFEQIPRHLVIPEKMGVMKDVGQTQGLIPYDKPAMLARLLQIGTKKDKGLFNRIAVLYIYKKNALAYWANFQSKFGIPPVIVKTDLTNDQKVNSLISFLEDMRSNSFALTGFDDVVEVLNITNRDAYSTFKEMIKLIDEKIAKMLEGQTMTSSDGSSLAQAEVHQDTSEDWHLGRLRRIEHLVNRQLLPILSADLGSFEGLEFRFKEIKDIDGIIDRVVKLSNAGYKAEAEWVAEQTGIPVEEAEQPVAAPKSVMKAIDALYEGIV